MTIVRYFPMIIVATLALSGCEEQRSSEPDPNPLVETDTRPESGGGGATQKTPEQQEQSPGGAASGNQPTPSD